MRFPRTEPLRIGAWLLLCLYLAAAQAQTVRLLVARSPLAGFNHHDAAAHFDEMRVGDALSLVREPDNPHDPKAIRIEWHGVKLGYLPRRENMAVAQELDSGGVVEARIAALTHHPDPRKRLLIELFTRL